MKKVILLFLVGICVKATAQKVLNNVIVTAKIETVRDGGDNEGGGGMMMMGGGETTIKMYFKDSMSKVEVKNNFMNSINLMDRNTGISTNLTEAQAEKTGYTQTPEDRENQKKRLDSITKDREKNPPPAMPGGMVIRIGGPTTVKNIEYLEETKVINNINCKKAIVTSVNNENVESKITVWYTNDFTLPNGVSLGAARIMNFGDLKGFPVMYETVRMMNFGGNEMTMTTTFTITEIKTEAKITDKDFEVPKGYKVKTYAEYIKDNPTGMPSFGGGRVMIRG
jgi:hypothetical protein